MLFVKIKPAGSNVTALKDGSSIKVIRMCIILSLLFTVSWAPFSILLLVNIKAGFAETVAYWKPFALLAMINSALNPVVYGLMWRPMRTSLHKVRFVNVSHLE